MKIVRALTVGDKITCKGVTVTIGEILEQDCYNPDYLPHDRHYIDIEFKDTNGKYRHWKSNQDGGTVIYKIEELFSKSRDGVTLLRAISPLEDFFRRVGNGKFIGYKLWLKDYTDNEPGLILSIVDSGVSLLGVRFIIKEDRVEVVSHFGDDSGLDYNSMSKAVYESLVMLTKLPFPVNSLNYSVGRGRTYKDVLVSKGTKKGEYKVSCIG